MTSYCRQWILSPKDASSSSKKKAIECAAVHLTHLTTAACVIVQDGLLSRSSRARWGSCHQPCMSLPAFSQCVGADGMAASRAQLQHQICFLSVMPNYGKETVAVYMLSLVGKRLEEQWEMSHSLFHTDTHLMLWLYLSDTHRSSCIFLLLCWVWWRQERQGHHITAWWNLIK